MRKIFSAAAFAAATIAMAGTASAASLYARTFLDKHGGSNCYGNEYDPSYHKTHPGFKILDIAVEARATAMDGAASTANKFGIRLGVSTLGGGDYRSLGDCRTTASNFSCQLEADGGSFRLAPVGRKLRLTTNRIEIEGTPKDLSIAPTAQNPTRSFTLDGGAAAPCDLD